MRAAVLQHNGDDRLEVVDDLEVLGPGPLEVTVRIMATGVCHSDLSIINGTLPQPTPAVLGHEGAGVVTAVGDGVTRVKPGDHVIVAWSAPCGFCINCTARRAPELCTTMYRTGALTPRFRRRGAEVHAMNGVGTFAEVTTIQELAAIVIDDDVPFDVASLVGCGVTTGVGAAINTAKVTPGSSVVVIGCGGVGIAAIQGARLAGASTVVAVDLVEAKRRQAEDFGATHSCAPDELEALKTELTGDGFDYALEAIGLGVTMRQAWDSVRRGGTACVVGAGRQNDDVVFSAFELFFNEKTLVGSYYGSADVRSDFHRLLALWRSGQLDLDGMITRRGDIDDVNAAFAAMQNGEVIRTVLTF
ncbi:MAG TPA: Zn-dependent alcohol dehydrogenase [Acidimicrobiales bacterium]|nr:Zn-dependent alcohol dehydrogenase [Acidimicrobiales bacterium]